MNLVCRYGPYDVTDRVEEFMEQGVFTLDLIRQRSGMKKNFAAIHQYMAQVSKEDPRKRIMPGKWMKRLMRYAVPDKLRGRNRSENYRFTGGTKECAVIK